MTTTEVSTMTQPSLRSAMDLITFFDPGFWGLPDNAAIRKPGAVPPSVFWDRVLDVMETTGVEGIEITSGIASYKSALERYGSAAQFASALKERGLALCSGFYPGLVYPAVGKLDSSGVAWKGPQRQAEILDEVAEYADFIVEAGSDIMVMGLPLRRSWNDSDPLFVDWAFATELSDLINKMAYVSSTRGVRLAIHTEARSTFWLRRDIDLFLALTDPVYVDFCPDTAHIRLGGADPVDVLADHHTRVSIAHWKDAIGSVSAQVAIGPDTRQEQRATYARVGTGIIDWQAWTRKLRDVNFTGWAVIELDAAKDPGHELTEARKYIETVANPIHP